MPFDDEVALDRQVQHFKGQLKAGRDDVGLAKEIILDVIGGCSCVSLFGSDRCRSCRAYYLLMGFVTAARESESPLREEHRSGNLDADTGLENDKD